LLSTVKVYGFAVVAAIAAVLLRWLLDPLIGDAFPFITLFGAVAGAVWVGGYRPALVTALIGYVASQFMFIEPRGVLGLNEVSLVGLIAYTLTCSLIIGFGQAARNAQRKAAEGSELLRITLRSIGDAVITTDTRGDVTYLNEVAENLTGWPLTDARGKPLDSIFAIVNEATGVKVENPAMRALREGVVVGLANHTVLIRRDGSQRAIDDSAAPIRDESGRVSGSVLIFRDVSAARQDAHEKARQLLTARLLASIVDSSDDAIISKNLDGIIQSWNSAAERLFGHTAAQAIGKHISLIIPPERLAEEDEIIARLRAGDRVHHYETERLRSDGRRVQVSLSISPIRDEAGVVVGASKIARDVTERKRAEAERQKFVTLVENSTDFIGLCDMDGIPFFVNHAGLELVGLRSIGEAMSTPVREFFFPEDQSWIMEEFLPQVLKDGHGEVEVRFRHFRTGEAIWMAYKVLLLTDDTGKPNAFATVSQNVTERRRMLDEVRDLAANLSEADRRKNEFLATLAHELRNPLAPISNAVQVLRRRGARDAESVESSSELLERQVAQMSRLVDDLIDMGRITNGRIELRKERVDLSTVVSQAVETTRAQYRSMNQELTIVMPEEPVFLYVDPTRLTQVLGNLLNNACKFSNRGGRVSLTVRPENGEVEIRVRDNGIGMTPDELPRVFEMFTQLDTSLERSRDGLGIGLTLVRTLVELHGGSVTVHSEGRGRGSEFVVRLPRVAMGETMPATDHETPPLPAPRRRILIVDDNEDGAMSLSMLLNLSGHETFTANDGNEALATFERLRPDVALLDIGLPGLNGFEVARRIRELPFGKDAVLVAVTGWGQADDRNRSREAGFDAHLVKPVNHQELTKLLASLPSHVGRS
jgi:PAS domain S-box-containing protein